MIWYRRLISQAGFGNPSLRSSLGYPALICLVAGSGAWLSTGVMALAIASSVLTFALLLELLKLRADRRGIHIVHCWPEVVESIQSGFQSGLGVARTFTDLANFGPKPLRQAFAAVVEALDGGVKLDDCLDWLKIELATEPSDRTIEWLRLLNQVGGQTSIEALSEHATSLRRDIDFESELRAKQGWVVTSAKLGLIAPWVIVLMLSRRSENLAVYNSPTGLAVLTGGLALCLLAYCFIQISGVTVRAKRVFAGEL